MHYAEEPVNEYDRLMELWTDISYIRNFGKTSSISDLQEFVDSVRKDAERIEDLMQEIRDGKRTLNSFFRPLNDLETGFKELSLQKGKLRRSYLRLYAIKIDEDIFLLTGGAIKIANRMEDSAHTILEKQKLNNIKDFLRSQDIFDADSFYELIIEENNE